MEQLAQALTAAVREIEQKRDALASAEKAFADAKTAYEFATAAGREAHDALNKAVASATGLPTSRRSL